MTRLSWLIIIGIILMIVVFLIRKLHYQIPNQSPIAGQVAGEIIAGAFLSDMQKTDKEWDKLLSPEQYHILREAGTEPPYSGELNSEKRSGTYYSVGCNQPIFRSEQKYDSGTGWPSFNAPIKAGALVLRKESKAGDDRIEVLDTCGGHLGHVFDDGPEPTGKRYCMNSRAMYFISDNK